MDVIPDTMTWIIHYSSRLAPVILPAILRMVSSIWDGTLNRAGGLSAKMCFAAVSFDVWGISTILRGDASLGSSTDTATSSLVSIVKN